ncbi:MAG: GNAT family N-acetyltransferase [Chitinophagaceae bacterium]
MIRLEYFTREDFNQLIEWISDEELMTNWSGAMFRFPLTTESMEWYIKDTNDLQTSDALVYKVVENATGQTVGHISLGGISRKNMAARISRVLLGPPARGKGYCSLMITEVLKVAFEELKLHRVTLGVYDFNESAIACYKKAGMQVEGIMRDALKFGDAYWTLVEMAMLEDEWRAMGKVNSER